MFVSFGKSAPSEKGTENYFETKPSLLIAFPKDSIFQKRATARWCIIIRD